MNVTGNPIVDEVSQLCIKPHEKTWYKTVVEKSGKPNRLAIEILDDLVYWYTWTEIRNEENNEISYSKKFRDADFVQRNYRQIADMFNATDKEIFRALKLLETLGVVKKHVKSIHTEFGVIPRVLYLELVPSVLRKLTFTGEEAYTNKTSNPKSVRTPKKNLSNSDNDVVANGKRRDCSGATYTYLTPSPSPSVSKTPLSSSEVSASTPPQQAVTTPTSTNSAEKNNEVHNNMTEQHKDSTENTTQSHTASSSVPVQRTVINHTVHTDSATNREEKERGHRRREKEISAHDREIVTDAYVRFYNETNAPKCKLDDALIRRCRYAVEKFGNRISEIIDKVNNSKFLQSENEFCKPDFAWVFAPGMKDKLWNCEKILNDKYRNSGKNDRGQAFQEGVKHNYGAWKK